MVKNLVIFLIVVWGNVCFGGDYKVVNLGLVGCYEDTPSDTLQIFFKRQEESYISAARITGSRDISLNNIHECPFIRKINFTDNDSFTRNKKGGFVVFGDSNPTYKYPLFCENKEGIKETFYVKVIHYTGLTEKLLDMPECTIKLGSDSVELVFDNKDGHNNRNEIYPHQTIIDPEHVKAIRNCIEQGKIFVINAQGSVNNKEASYKILGYKNSAYIHWDGWLSMRLFWRGVKELNGFEHAKDVQPEEEMALDLKKDWSQLSRYKIHKNLREMFYVFIGFWIAFKLYDTIK